MQRRLLPLLIALLLATPVIAMQDAERWADGDPLAPDPPNEVAAPLQARLIEAERLSSSGDFTMAATVLKEAATLAAGQPAEVDAVDRVSAQIEFRRGRYPEALTLQRGILERASARGDTASVARAETDIAILLRRQGDLAPALSGFERALAQFRQLDDRNGVADVLTHVGLIRLNQGLYSTALESLRESLKLQQAGARAEIERTYHYLGLLYAGMREYETARRYLERGLAEARRLADPSREAPLLGSMARTANLAGSFSEALTLALEAERLAERLGSPPGQVYALIENGRAKLGLNRLSEANEALQRGALIAERIGQRSTLARYRALLAEAAARQNRPEEALALWQQALPEFQSGDDQPQLLDSYKVMIPLLREQGDGERALDIAIESLSLQEQISGLDMNRRVAVMESAYRAEESERQIELLQRDLEIQALKLRQEALGRWLATFGVLSLLLVAGLLGFRYRESRRLSRQLEETNRELESNRTALGQANVELEKRAEALALAASVDPLTGIANRRAFVERFEVHWADAISRHSALSIALIDADHFKRINDTAGHAVGDAVLCALAVCIQGLLRAGTLLARWGGEEFVVLIPGANSQAAAGLAERLRAAVESLEIEGLPRVTISIGVASLSGRSRLRPEGLFDEADGALYAAKTAGRNCVVVADEPGSGAVG
ncbi:diguanylate cyclase [Aquimonas sp.]|uniref:GGDEF domain-containing protein n=1 Tax=Aquimonas sp. TaxID=1872588 RepID=UPI0037BF906C